MTFKEADLKKIGGLSEGDRMVRGIGELVPLAIRSCEAFKEAMTSGRGIKRWWYSAQMAVQTLREANSESALGFLVRKGVQTTANDWYQTTPRAWQDYCRVEGSSTLAEWYAPLYPSTIADRVMRGQGFPEGRIQGEDSALVNQKFGLVESIDRELFDDDQTGQIRQRAQRLGQSMGITESVWASSKFVGAKRTYANVTVPASNYATTDINGTAVTSPFSTTLYGSSSGNALQTYETLHMGSIKLAYVQCLNAVDPLQNKIIVDPNTLLVSSQDKVNADILVAPGPYPAVVGQSSATLANNPTLGGNSATAGASQGALTGFPGGWGSPNPLAGMGLKVVLERYLPDWVCAIGERGKGIVFQERDPLEIVQETPNSGNAFTFDQIRFRSRRRFEVDWIAGGSRFWVLINDGTVTGNQ